VKDPTQEAGNPGFQHRRRSVDNEGVNGHLARMRPEGWRAGLGARKATTAGSSARWPRFKLDTGSRERVKWSNVDLA